MNNILITPRIYELPEFGNPNCIDAQIHQVLEDYKKSTNKKKRRELKAEYVRLTSLDFQLIGWKRYAKL